MKSLGWIGCCAICLWVASFPRCTCAADFGTPPGYCHCAGDSAANVARINRVLTDPLKPAGLEFTEEPLENVVNFLQTEYEIPIQVDGHALEDAALTSDEPVTINLHNISLRAALRLMLKQLNLTYMICDEVLLITTPDRAEEVLSVCVYDVRDLIGNDRGDRQIKALVDAIVCCIAKETWANNKSGNAEIKTLPPGLLVVSQTSAVHEEIERLLTAVRETLRQPVPGQSIRGTATVGVGDLFGGHRGMEERDAGSRGRGDDADHEPTPANGPFD